MESKGFKAAICMFIFVAGYFIGGLLAIYESNNVINQNYTCIPK